MPLRTFDTLADALAAKTEGFVVSGVYRNRQRRVELLKDDPDLFFLSPAGADDDEMRQLSYEALHGEPMPADEARYQRGLIKQAEQMHRDGLL